MMYLCLHKVGRDWALNIGVITFGWRLLPSVNGMLVIIISVGGDFFKWNMDLDIWKVTLHLGHLCLWQVQVWQTHLA